jgi:hypothetical protein
MADLDTVGDVFAAAGLLPPTVVFATYQKAVTAPANG